MLGALLVFIYCLMSIGLGHLIIRRVASHLDPAANLGISGLVALALSGTLVFFIGMASLSGSILLATGFVVIGGLVGWRHIVSSGHLRVNRPNGVAIFILLALSLIVSMALTGVFAPSTSNDWDSLAYHLAVPKLWLQAGKVEVVPFIHQSNFPFAVDSLSLIGLKWGGQSAAKLFIWMITLLGLVSVFGLARQRYGLAAGWWSCLIFAAIPIVAWQSGTAYIDVAHGLFAGLGLVFACRWLESNDNRDAWLSGILLGLAASTKYTGLQTIAVAGILTLVGAALFKQNLKPVFIIGLAALAIASPWYLKNVAWKDNPVFPFFYSVLKGRDWDSRRAEIYTVEQNTFGVGRQSPPDGSLSPLRLGHSILGLAYQPGRYVNPQQTAGGGEPLGAVGIAVVGALLLSLLAGQRERFEKGLVAGVLLSLAIWFVLTQQSRYIVALGVPLAMLGAQLTNRRGFGSLMASLATVQAIATIYLYHSRLFTHQMQVVTGSVSREEYQARRIPFYVPAQAINQLGPNTKVALFDEVFGFLLDVPYYWANPGHSTQIPYDSIQTGEQFTRRMKEMGFTHAYLNLRAQSPETAAAMQNALSGQPLPVALRDQAMGNWQVKFNPLIADSVRSGHMSVVQSFGNPSRPQPVLLKFN